MIILLIELVNIHTASHQFERDFLLSYVYINSFDTISVYLRSERTDQLTVLCQVASVVQLILLASRCQSSSDQS